MSADIKMTASGLSISGDVNYETLPDLLKRSEGLLSQWTQQKTGCVVDFSKIGAHNASILALMLALLRKAGQQKLILSFSHLPVSIKRMADAFGLTKLLSID